MYTIVFIYIFNLFGNTEIIQLGYRLVGKVLLRAFEGCREHAEWSKVHVATKGTVEMGEEDGMVDSETASTLGGGKVVLNKADCQKNLINEVRHLRG